MTLIGPEDFVDLHVHTTFSYLDGIGHPADVIKRAAELGRKAIAITDHGSVSGHPYFEIAAGKSGIKPIFGCEVYQTGSAAGDKANKKRVNRHLSVLARNERGYQNLLGLVSQSYRDFYYKPLTDNKNLGDHLEGLVVMSGCLSGHIAERLLINDFDGALKAAQAFRDALGDDYYLETQLFDLDDTRKVNYGVMDLAKQTGIPLVMTGDVHMMTEDQRDVRKLLHKVRDGKGWYDEDAGDFQYLSEYQLLPHELEHFADKAGLLPIFKEAAENTLAIAEKCTVAIPKSEFIHFPIPCLECGEDEVQHDGSKCVGGYVPRFKSNAEMFYQQIHDGCAFRGVDFNNPTIKARILYEAGLIESKNFTDYFLVVGDLVRWSKDQGILVGPSRGSSAGSLICWLLRITEINPLDFGLLFERFIDVLRSDLPDIDIDFDSNKRQQVRDYMARKYGNDRVGMLGTFTQWKGKNALDSVGRVFGIPKTDVETVKNLIIDRSSADARAGATIEDTFSAFPAAEAVAKKYPDIMRAVALEGQYKGWSTHACGFMVSSRPLEEVCAFYYKPDDPHGIVSVDKKGADHLGLIKIDILGISALSVIQECLTATGMSMGDLYDMTRPDSLADPMVLDGFSRQDIFGIFQFEGNAMRSVLSEFDAPVTFAELADMVALCRPGPLHGGMTRNYVLIRNGIGEPTTLHPSVDEQLAYTYGQVVYQEQLLNIARYVGQMTWESINDLRNSMARKYGKEHMNSMREEFVTGSVKSGLTEAQAIATWESMVSFGQWAFNLSHSVGYAILAYWAMYFKQHYPTQFYAAALNNGPDDNLKRMYLLEFQRKGGVILPPHINKSGSGWTVDSHMRIRAGFAAIDGIGDTVAARIVAGQPYADAADLAGRRTHQPTIANPNRMAVVANKAHIAALDRVGAWSDEEAMDDFLGLKSLTDALDNCGATHKIGLIQHADEGDMFVAGVLSRRNQRSTAEEEHERSRRVDPVTGELQIIERRALSRPDLDEFCIFNVEDDTGIIVGYVNRFRYPKFKQLIWQTARDGDIVLLQGTKSAGRRRVDVDYMEIMYRQRPDRTYQPYDQWVEEQEEAEAAAAALAQEATA